MRAHRMWRIDGPVDQLRLARYPAPVLGNPALPLLLALLLLPYLTTALCLLLILAVAFALWVAPRRRALLLFDRGAGTIRLLDEGILQSVSRTAPDALLELARAPLSAATAEVRRARGGAYRLVVRVEAGQPELDGLYPVSRHDEGVVAEVIGRPPTVEDPDTARLALPDAPERLRPLAVAFGLITGHLGAWLCFESRFPVMRDTMVVGFGLPWLGAHLVALLIVAGLRRRAAHVGVPPAELPAGRRLLLQCGAFVIAGDLAAIATFLGWVYR